MSQRASRLGRSRSESGTKAKKTGLKVPPTKMTILLKTQIVSAKGATRITPEKNAFRSASVRGTGGGVGSGISEILESRPVERRRGDYASLNAGAARDR